MVTASRHTPTSPPGACPTQAGHPHLLPPSLAERRGEARPWDPANQTGPALCPSVDSPVRADRPWSEVISDLGQRSDDSRGRNYVKTVTGRGDADGAIRAGPTQEVAAELRQAWGGGAAQGKLREWCSRQGNSRGKGLVVRRSLICSETNKGSAWLGSGGLRLQVEGLPSGSPPHLHHGPSWSPPRHEAPVT